MPAAPEGRGSTRYRLAPADHPVTVVLLHGLGGDLRQPWDDTDARVRLAGLIPGAEYAEIAGRDPSPGRHRAELRLRLDTFLAKL
jgi:hypothetical protein